MNGPWTVSTRYHRNGSGGEGYYVVVFMDDVDDDGFSLLAAIVPEGESTRAAQVLVLDLEDPGRTLRGADTWGAWAIDKVHAAVEDGSAYQRP